MDKKKLVYVLISAASIIIGSIITGIFTYQAALESKPTFQESLSEYQSEINQKDEEISSLKEQIQALSSSDISTLTSSEASGTSKVTSIPVDKNRISASDVKLVNDYEWEFETDTIEDSLGNEFQHYLVGYSDAYGEYYTNGKYSRITGTIACHAYQNEYSTSQINIYIDGKESPIYSSEEITRTSDPINFDVDISGARLVKIEVAGDTWNSRLILTNLYFH